MFKFNDEFVKPKINDLLAIEIPRHFIPADKVKAVIKVLELNKELKFDELVAIRNSVVKLLSAEEKKASEADQELFCNTISGVVAVIDDFVFYRK